ncbi:hypothetical protein [Bermanella sp. R86510]|uniref:hypothetical protein n=1 Tax=unclassified Bermanella TaxID=2627862 RepID=UPI0037CBF7DC
MKNNELLKLFSVSVLAAALAACGSDSDDNNNDGGDTGGDVTFNTNANSAFSFDQTTYVGAVDPAATGTMWYEFALDGSYPETAAEIVTVTSGAGAVEAWTDSVAANHTANMANITPAAECPALADGTVVNDGTVELDGKTFQKCKLSGSIDTDVTLSNDVVWSLVGQVVVGNGNRQLTASNSTVDNVTLTIDAGTVFMSKEGSALFVTRGSKINAEGTATQPIIMAGDTTETFGGASEWGGLVVQGYGYHNKCGDPATNPICNQIGEGDSGFFAGNNNADNSGVLKYLIITEAGAQTGSDGDELNGISFQAVGYGTTVEYVQVHNNFDDGVEFFGGAVDAKHLVLTAVKDDSIDWDEGYVGNIQYALIVQTEGQENTTKSSNYVFELDTAGDGNESTYESNATVANVTALVSRSGGTVSDGIHQKKGSEGQFFNIFMGGDINNCLAIEDNTVGTSYDSREDAYQNVYCVGAQAEVTKPDDSAYANVELASTAASNFVLNDNLAVTGTPTVTATIASKETDRDDRVAAQ